MPEDGAGGPLAGVRVVELAGIGPGPFCVMLLADMGATVVRVDRVGGASADYTVNPVIERGRRSVAVDLKSPDGVQVVLDLVRRRRRGAGELSAGRGRAVGHRPGGVPRDQ